MEVVEAQGYYFPTGFQGEVGDFKTEIYQGEEVAVHLKIPRVTRDTVKGLAGFLKENREKHLTHLSIERIIDVLDEASRRWLDKDYPYRKHALKTIPIITGFSPEVVAASIDVEMESSLREDILNALRSEIENPLYLDDFQYSHELRGFRRAFGPELIVSFFSENIPALPHLLFMRAALVKAACMGKVASGEPLFAPLYLKTVEDINPEMARCMAVLYWQGGDEEVEDEVFGQADAVILFGGVKACKSIMQRIPRRTKVLLHGHKLGFGVIGRKRMCRGGLEELANAVAYDHAMFDQQACLTPQVYYLEEGGEVSPLEFTQVLAKAMDVMQVKMPRGKISTGEAAVINQLKGRYEIRELKGESVQLFASSHGTDWTVVYEKDSGAFRPSPLNRFVRVLGVDDIFQILPTLRPLSPFLQNAAVAIGDEREKVFIERLGELGVTRVTAPGKMVLPSMMWRHDGISPLASLLRWCDVEKNDSIQGMESKNKGEVK